MCKEETLDLDRTLDWNSVSHGVMTHFQQLLIEKFHSLPVIKVAVIIIINV